MVCPVRIGFTSNGLLLYFANHYTIQSTITKLSLLIKIWVTSFKLLFSFWISVSPLKKWWKNLGNGMLCYKCDSIYQNVFFFLLMQTVLKVIWIIDLLLWLHLMLCNGYHLRKWTWWPEFKLLTKLFAFQKELIPLRNV